MRRKNRDEAGKIGSRGGTRIHRYAGAWKELIHQEFIKREEGGSKIKQTTPEANLIVRENKIGATGSCVERMEKRTRQTQQEEIRERKRVRELSSRGGRRRTG